MADPPRRLPVTRADCPRERPCPHDGCRYHLPTACALDLADRGAHTLEAVAEHIGVSLERVRQIERAAMNRLVALVGEETLRDLLGGRVHGELHLLSGAVDDGAPPEIVRASHRRRPRPLPASQQAILDYLGRHGPTPRDVLWRALGLPSAIALGNAIHRLRALGRVTGGGTRHHPTPYRLTSPASE